MQRPALVFDFGNVVAHFDFTKACNSYGRTLGISGLELLQRLRRQGFSAILQQYECGAMSTDDFFQSVCTLMGLEIPRDEFVTAWSDIFSLNKPVAKLIETLASRGYTLVLGSNTNDLHATWYRRQFATTMAHFRRLVLSYEIGHAKPARSFYDACVEAAGLPPQDCIFIDDLDENVAGAVAAGLRALVFRDTATLVSDLRELGVDA